MSISSNSAIVEHAKNGKRHEIRDKSLISISRHGSCTSSEIAMNVLESEGVVGNVLSLMQITRISIRVASIQKRVSDLLKLNYIVKSSSRTCRVTNYSACVYVISDLGKDYLRNSGQSASHNLSNQTAVRKPRDLSTGMAALKSSKALLG